MNKLPRMLLFIGPMKAGTSWIHDYLESRGDVILPKDVKELFFFDRLYSRGLEWYAGRFTSNPDELPIVEVAPSYFPNPDVPIRVAQSITDAKVVATLRHPIKRSWSHYLHLRRYGYTTKSLQNAVIDHPQIIQASLYGVCLRQWCDAVGEENVEVLWQDDMYISLDNYAEKICKIVDIPFIPVPDTLRGKSNETAVAPSSNLAAIGRKASYAIRDLGLYKIVKVAKKLGLKRIFYGKPGAKPVPEISELDYEWLKTQLEDDFNSLDKKYIHPLVKL